MHQYMKGIGREWNTSMIKSGGMTELV